MTPCWPIPKFRPYFRMVDLAPFWLPATSPVMDKHFLLGALSPFHPSSGAGASKYHFARAISMTTGPCAATCVANWNSGGTRPYYIHSGTAPGTNGSICWERRSRSRARLYGAVNTANVAESGNSSDGRPHCQAGSRSNSHPISSSNWRQPERPITALVNIHGRSIRSGCAWNIGRSNEGIWSKCVPNCVFRAILTLPRSAGVRITTRSSIANSHAGRAGSTCFARNTFSTLRKLLSSKRLSLATQPTYLPISEYGQLSHPVHQDHEGRHSAEPQ